jgi:hypothetical protein
MPAPPILLPKGRERRGEEGRQRIPDLVSMLIHGPTVSVRV